MNDVFTLITITLILVAIPGPNVALIVANSLSYGARFGLASVAGTTIGVGLQLILVVTGLSTALLVTAEILYWVKWLGVMYLLYLGYKSWSGPPIDLNDIGPDRPDMRTMFRRGLFVAVINPKTLLFNAAFIPLFVATEGASAGDFALVSLVFLLVLSFGDALWAVLASYGRRYIVRYGQYTNRLSGVLFASSRVGLAVSRSQ